MNNNSDIMVSIRCLAYNQKDYIRQCLEGFIMQKTNFRFEAIVHDDASTDGTDDIIREYAQKYPEIIIPIFETENLYSKKDGSIERIMDAYMHGKYIAICEGDDYWIDPLKLQKQVDFMEENPEYGLVWGRAKCFIQDRNVYTKDFIGHNANILDDLVLKNSIPTLTALFRTDLYKGYDNYISGTNFLMGDKPLWCYLASVGKIKFHEDIYAVYRVLQDSTSCRNNYYKRINFYKSSAKVSLFFNQKFHLGLEKKILKLLYKNLYKVSYSFKEYFKCSYYLIKYLYYNLF